MIKNKTPLFILTLIFAVSALLVYKNFFLSGPLAAGDAPFFVYSALKGLITEPLGWTYRGINFGGINQFLWISPLMIIYGFLGNLIGNDLTIRLLFYFPSLVLGSIGIYLLARNLGIKTLGKIFSIALYVLNTYIIMLIDGGQVGIALAYGLFPLTLYTTVNYLNKRNFLHFIVVLISNMALMISDPRIYLIGLVMIVGFLVLQKKGKDLRFLPVILLPVILMNSYWIIPLFVNGAQTLGTEVSQLELTSLLNGLLLYQPHWFENVYGKVSYPPFYFVIFPILFIWGLFKVRSRLYAALFLMFLVFAFLIKGTTSPAGDAYSLILSLPFGFAFRDSSKFFIPLLVCASLMLGLIVQQFKNQLTVYGAALLLLVGILPAIQGKLQFVLGDNNQALYTNIVGETESGRVAWFPFKPATGVETKQLESIDARDLTEIHIFANNNAGSFDRFNYMRNMNFVDWYRLFGINKLALVGDLRNTNLSSNEQQSWDEFKQYMTSLGLTRDDESGVPVYTINEAKQKFLGAERLVAVVGSDTVASPNIPSVYVEDGNFNMEMLDTVSPDSVTIYFNAREKIDLQMSLLQEYFESPFDSTNSAWSRWSSDQYLQWKYELLIRGMDIRELDYKKGIAFSTQTEEKLEWNVNVPQREEYVLAVRSLGNEESQIKLRLNNKDYTVEPQNNFSWSLFEVGALERNQKIDLINQSGVSVVNVISFIPKKDFDAATVKTKVYLDKFKTITEREYAALMSQAQWTNINSIEKSNLHYTISGEPNVNWVFVSDRYSPLWQLRKGISYYPSIPVYSYFNGFYLPADWSDTEIVFTGQENVLWGLYFTGLSAVITVICCLYYLSTQHESKN